jgi:hypothetical protein
MIKRTLAAGSLAIGFLLTSVAPAHAARPQMVEHFDEEFTEPDGFLTDLCGFDITITVDVRGSIRTWDDGRFLVTRGGSEMFTNVATGTTLTRDFHGLVKGRETLMVDEGILTINFDEVYAGIPERIRGDDGTILIADRGRARLIGEIIVDLGNPDDPFDDELISEDIDATFNGPHPILAQGFLDPALACDLLA